MGNFQLPRPYGLNRSGATIPGAKLFFYDAGTTTEITVYEDEANSTAHPNPVLADGDGRFPPIWIPSTQGAFKVTLQDEDGTQIYTEDNLKPYDTADGTTVERTIDAHHSPLDYGGVGDGTTDDSTAVQDALDAVGTDGGGIVDLLGKTWRVDSQLTVPAYCSLINGTIDFSQAATAPDPCILVASTKQASQNLTSSADPNHTDIDVTDGSVFSTGEMAAISSTDTIWTSVEDGELVRVKSIASNTITVESPLVGQYTTGNSAKIVRIDADDLLQQIVFEDVRLLMDAGASSSVGVRLDGCHDVVFRNCRIDDAKTGCIDVRYSMGVRIEGCTFRDSGGYGVLIARSSTGVSVHGCIFHNCAGDGVTIGATSGGLVHSADVDGCSFYGCGTAGVSIEPAAHATTIRSCKVNGAGSTENGIQVYGHGVDVSDNDIRDMGGHGMVLEYRRTVTYTTDASTGKPPNADREGGYKIHRNHIAICDDAGIKYTANTTAVQHKGIRIVGNDIAGIENQGIYFDVLADVSDIWVNDNRINEIKNAGSEGIWFDVDTAATCKHLTVRGNIVTGCGTGLPLRLYADDPTDLSDVLVADNYFDDEITLRNIEKLRVFRNTIESTGKGIGYVPSGSAELRHIKICGNLITGITGDGILISGSSGDMRDILIANNTIEAPATATSAAINVFTNSGFGQITERVCIQGNVIDGGDDCVRVHGSGARHVTITGNVLDNSVNNGIEIDSVQFASVSNNTIGNTTLAGIRVDDCNDVSVCGNTFEAIGDDVGVHVDCDGANGSGFSIAGNTFVNCGVQVEASGQTVDTVSVSGNIFREPSAHCVYLFAVDGSSTIRRASVTGNTMDPSGSNSGVRLNAAAATGTCTIEKVAITGNEIEVALEPGIVIEGGAAASIGRIMIASNQITVASGTDYCVECNVDASGTFFDSCVVGNQFNGSTSNVLETSGTFTMAATTTTAADMPNADN